MKNSLLFVSVIIPARNEEAYIAKCLDSILKNDYPKEKLEVFIIDGMSIDGTKDIASKYAKKHSFVNILENPKKTTPAAMNLGIKAAKGEFIMKMDAHTVYEEDYISKCVQYSKEYGADNVGGILVSLPGNDTFVAKAIALGLMQKFGSGNSYFRVGAKEPREVDTVAFGCFKREVFERIGMYNENLARSQDMELNQRLRKAGGKIVLVPNIVGYYYAKPDFTSFFKHNIIDGIWTTYPLAFRIRVFSLRHLVPLVFVITLVTLAIGSFYSSTLFLGLLAFVIIYLLASLFVSIVTAAREKDIRYTYILPIVFAVRHIGYGIGSLIGLWKVLVFKLNLGYNT